MISDTRLCSPSPEIPHIEAVLGFNDIDPSEFRRQFPEIIIEKGRVLATCESGAITAEVTRRKPSQKNPRFTTRDTVTAFGITVLERNSRLEDSDGLVLTEIYIIPSPQTLRRCMEVIGLGDYAFYPEYCTNTAGKNNTIEASHFADHLFNRIDPMSNLGLAEHDASLFIHRLGAMLFDSEVRNTAEENLGNLPDLARTREFIVGYDELTSRICIYLEGWLKKLSSLVDLPDEIVIAKSMLELIHRSPHFKDFQYFFSPEVLDSEQLATAVQQTLSGLETGDKPTSKSGANLHDFTLRLAKRARKVLETGSRMK
ncbi:hypothetical protein KC960_04125 [Candidatus Saccharibacteria bacterium]|nr:hypothetical protein [Candidatus Saccharibacteria bacterium]